MLCLFVFAGLFLFVLPASAQQEALTQLGAEAGLSTTPLPIIIARIIRAFLGVLGVVLVVLVIYGGFVYMTAGGDAAKVDRAKLILRNAFIGLIITLSAFGITQFILSRLLSAAGLGGITSSVADQFSEPLSGSLGAGIIQDHFPPRNALDIPRNAKVFITFKEPINPASFIEGYDPDNPVQTDLNADAVRIFPTEEGDSASLGSADFLVAVDDTHQTFVFDPIPLLGDGVDDVNYTVAIIGSEVQRENGSAAFTGAQANGYSWSFEVGTEIDLTPPVVESIIPTPSPDPYDKNITAAITFNEAMDPVAGTGTYDGAGEFFNNLEVLTGGANVNGTFAISNGYRTIDFTPTEACGQDPCGDTIFCLPGDETVSVQAHAASLGDEPPQGLQIGVSYDGLVDAAGNSLDGNDDGIAQGSSTDNSESPDENDDYDWTFQTSDNVNDEVPQITHLFPGIQEGDIDPDRDVEITFSTPMKASTINSSTVQLWPDPYYEFWFVPRQVELAQVNPEVVATPDDQVVASKVLVKHPTLVSTEAGGWEYFPLANNDVKSAYQICMHPALGPASGSDTGTCNTSPGAPYCCNGSASATACPSSEGLLPPVLE